jgi:hypothetical protein
MGSRAKIVVCYGIDYGAEEESADAAKFWYGQTDPVRGDTSPAGLTYWGCPPDSPVAAVTYGHHDYRRYVLAAAALVTTGRAYQPVPLEELIPNLTAVDDGLRAYCEKHGLTYSQPRWLAVPYYG